MELLTVDWVLLTLVLLGAYSYFFYPLILWLLNRAGQSSMTNVIAEDGVEPQVLPRISIIIAVHNEESRILDKLRNTLELEYPQARREILVCSDCSTDGTEIMALRFAQSGVRLIRNSAREGKEMAQWLGIRHATGDVLVFTDASAMLRPDALMVLARHFSDSAVGAVSSTDLASHSAMHGTGEGAYLRYEMALRQMESHYGGLIGMSGSAFSARKDLCTKVWHTDIPSDFAIALACQREGLRARHAADFPCTYPGLRNAKAEFGRKRRTASRGMRAFLNSESLIRERWFSAFGFQLLSHKLMRWLVPWFMLATLFLSIAAAPFSAFAAGLLALQIMGYGAAWLGHRYPGLQDFPSIRIAYFFVQVNAAILLASLDLFRGESPIQWQPSAR